MGWWRTDDNQDVIGDGPADTVAQTLQTIVTDRDRRNRPKPSLQELVDAIAAALPGGSGENEVTLQLEPAARNVHGRPDQVDRSLLPPWREAFDAIRLEYEESELNRAPTVSELLESVAFVLRPALDRYVSDASGIRLIKLVST